MTADGSAAGTNHPVEYYFIRVNTTCDSCHYYRGTNSALLFVALEPDDNYVLEFCAIIVAKMPRKEHFEGAGLSPAGKKGGGDVDASKCSAALRDDLSGTRGTVKCNDESTA